ncbi:MAG: sensor histidine kinase [Clostridium sp.]
MLIFSIWLLPIVSYIISDYYSRRKYYKVVLDSLETLDKKTLIGEVIEEAPFVDGQILYNIIKETSKNMNDEINREKLSKQEYREYIETWVHEIKIPISSSKLIIENNKDKNTLSILEELNKVEGFIDQALYYARSNDVEKDYIIKEFKLKSCINNVIKKNSKYFIQNRIKLEMDDIIDTVFSDVKWVEFILNQIINNAIKYSKSSDAIIKIYTLKNEQNISLYIEDNGIGIEEKYIRKLFTKGFTGESGRVFEKSTGIGLYLCRKLCGKLGLTINISSKINAGTKVEIIFPKSKMMILES